MTLGMFRRRLYYRMLILGLPIFLCATFVSYLLHRAAGADFFRTFITPLIVGCIVMLLALPLVRKWAISEYEHSEKFFEETGSQLILNAFGPDAFRKLYFDDANFIPLQAIDVCREMLQSEESKTNRELQFHLLAKLSRYYYKDGQLQAAIESLRTALAIKPSSLIANYRIAYLFERMGKADEAVTHYELAEKDKTASSNLKKHIDRQIQRVRIKGPRERGPFDGSGVWWMWG
ncbi:MAG: Tetratricopeptide repeat protein [Syntrophorhabdus sp. PtaU1.Bin058]|nr:MAG: Tetratricopeptide repeat protein [Syntrophorhabdus sp. PtaU1.Bin058]